MLLLDRANQQFGAVRAHRPIVAGVDAVDEPVNRRRRISLGHAIQFKTFAFVGQCVDRTVQNGRRFQHF